jgi:Helix-turn-helix.
MEKTINSKAAKVLREWLIAARKGRGMSMHTLGNKLGVVHTFVQRVENGERRLDLVELVRYCKALDLDPYEAIEIIKANIKE